MKMAVDRNNLDELQARIDALIEEFRAARQRQLVQRGIELWNRTEAEQRVTTWRQPPPRKKVH
jgi:hypothetical protein